MRNSRIILNRLEFSLNAIEPLKRIWSNCGPRNDRTFFLLVTATFWRAAPLIIRGSGNFSILVFGRNAGKRTDTDSKGT
jgi:hypothetical protein